MTRRLLALLVLAPAITPAWAQTPPPASALLPPSASAPPPPSASAPPARAAGHGRPFLDPLGKLWEVPGQDGLDAWFQATDANHDGLIDRAEISAAARAWHAQLDLNHDGVIDPDEETAYETDRTGGHGALVEPAYGRDEGAPEDRGRGGRRRGHRRGGPGGDDPDRTGALMDVSNPVISADTNLDRGVSVQEAVAAATRRLALLDVNGDGKLSLDEARQRRAAQQSTQRQRRHTFTPADQPPPSDN